MRDVGLFLVLLCVLIVACILCNGCASALATLTAHPGQVLAGWLIAQFLTLGDILSLLFCF